MDPKHLADLARTARKSRTALDEAIVTAATEEVPQPVIAEATGLSVAQIRRIERAGGVPPRATGRRKKDTNAPE